MAISSAGLGSNIDVNSLVSQLMALERRPLDVLNQRKSLINAKISAMGKISSSLSAFQSAAAALKDADGFKLFTATAANTDYLSVSAGSTASKGNHSITITQLAQAQKLVSTTFTDTNTVTVGTGTLTFSNGTDSFAVTIDSTNNTLDGIVNAVNAAADNFGVSASILNDGTGYRLLFGPNDTGTAKAISVTVNDSDGFHTDASGLSRLHYSGGGQLTQTQAARNAIISVDGLSGIQKSSNTITDVIQGVTLNLKTDTGAPLTTNVTVAVDSQGIADKVTTFVNAYNKLVTEIQDLRKKGGTLEADNTLLTIQAQLVGVFNSQASISGISYNYLSQVGISLQANGTLSMNASTFKDAVTSRFGDVQKLFTDTTQGFMQRFYSESLTLLQADGIVDARSDGLNSSITDINTRIGQLENRLASTERRLRAQFTALDSLLGTMQSTSNLLLRQLS